MTKDNACAKNTRNNFASQGFIDLFLSEESILFERKIWHKLLNHRVYYFQQGIEKFLKACLTQKDIKVKDYGHNFSKLIKGITQYYPDQSFDFMQGLAQIGTRFYETFEETCKNDIKKITFKKEEEIFTDKNFNLYGKGLYYYAWYLKCLECGFSESRYKEGKDLKKLYVEKPFYGYFYHPYLNTPIIVATRFSASLIMNLFNKQTLNKIDELLDERSLLYYDYGRKPAKAAVQQYFRAKLFYQNLERWGKEYFPTVKIETGISKKN